MDTAFLVELYGYLGSALVIVSMLMTSVVKLRIISVMGNIISSTYALIIGSFPLALMNGCLIFINIYNLIKLLRPQKQYDIVPGNMDFYVQYFLSHYCADIKTYFPGFDELDGNIDTVYLVCCDADPVGILLGKDMGDGCIDVVLDYSIPAYRDCSVGKYLYSKLPEFGVSRLMFTQNSADTHGSYLVKMGFTCENGIYTRNLR